MAVTSPIPRPEEEKGPSFSHSCMHLIAVEFHQLLIDFRTLMTPLNATLSID